MKGAQLFFFGELVFQGGPYSAEHRTTAPLFPAEITNPVLPAMQVSELKSSLPRWIEGFQIPEGAPAFALAHNTKPTAC